MFEISYVKCDNISIDNLGIILHIFMFWGGIVFE